MFRISLKHGNRDIFHNTHDVQNVQKSTKKTSVRKYIMYANRFILMIVHRNVIKDRRTATSNRLFMTTPSHIVRIFLGNIVV